MANTKLDLIKEYKTYYNATTKPELIEFSEAQYLAIEGEGAPAGEEFNTKIEALYPMAYGVKNITKKTGKDFAVPKLEGLWWVESDKPFEEIPREEWHWQLLIRMPAYVTLEIVEQARIEVYNKKKNELINQISFEKANEGSSVQIMHIGPYSTEPETIEVMHKFIDDNNLKPNGLHHEIYISDPRRAAPEKMKTILRQPVKKK